jgi:DNA-binding transcriptional LysR family regulator
MIEQGIGVSLMPSWTVREEIKNGKLAQIRIQNHVLKRTIAMVSLKGSKSSPIRAFIAYILEQKELLQEMASSDNQLQ